MESKDVKAAGNDIYEKLRQHINQESMTKLRKTKELMEMLSMMYTPEQVEYAMALPLSSSGRITVKDLAEQMGRDTAEVEKNVECMAREGRVLVTTSRKDGTKIATRQIRRLAFGPVEAFQPLCVPTTSAVPSAYSSRSRSENRGFLP